MNLRFTVILILILWIVSCKKKDTAGTFLHQDKLVPDTTIVTAGDLNLLTPYDSLQDLKNSIPVGLLVLKHPAGRDISWLAWKGAELAIENANENGAYRGKLFKLIVRSCDGPWGTGSKQTVNLVFTEHVIAILGAVDGRNAHLLEQVIAKTHVPAIGCLATESTITEAFVPWFFRCVPNDRQQAEILARNIYSKNKSEKVILISSLDYDSRNAADVFVKKAEDQGLKIHARIELPKTDKDTGGSSESLIIPGSGAIIFFSSNYETHNIIAGLRKNKSFLPLYANTWMFYGDTLDILNENNISGLQWLVPAYRQSKNSKKFEENFKRKNGYPPDLSAAYAYDGMQLIIESIILAEANPQKIRDAIAGIDLKEGVTGRIRFDQHGNRKDYTLLIENPEK